MADISRGLNRQKFLHDLLRQWEAQTFESRSELRTMIDEKKDEMTQNIYSLFRKMFRGREVSSPVHAAAAVGMNPPDLRLLIWDHTDSVQKGEPLLFGALPLHLCCASGGASPSSHLNRIACILAAHPAAAGRADDLGRLPLHYAAAGRAGVGASRAILAAHPAAAGRADDAGCLPLHYALRSGSDVEVVRELVGGHPACLSAPLLLRRFGEVRREDGADGGGRWKKTPHVEPIPEDAGANTDGLVSQITAPGLPGLQVSPLDVLSIQGGGDPGQAQQHLQEAEARAMADINNDPSPPRREDFLPMLPPSFGNGWEEAMAGFLPVHVACCTTGSSVAVVYELLHTHPAALLGGLLTERCTQDIADGEMLEG